MALRGCGRVHHGSTLEHHASQAPEHEEDTPLQEEAPRRSTQRNPLTVTSALKLADPHATRRAIDILKRRWKQPWMSWRDVPGPEREAMWEYFMRIYSCEDDDLPLLRQTWEASMQRRITGILDQARRAARVASGSEDFCAWLGHHPQWMGAEIWAKMIDVWNIDEWRQHSQSNKQNKLTEKEGGMTKHTGGSIPFITHRERMATSEGIPSSQAEVFRRTHTRKGTDEFVDPRSSKFMEDYEAALSQRHGDSSSYPVDVDADAWMQEAGDSGKGRVYGYTPGESLGECSSAPRSRSCAARGIHIDESQQSSGPPFSAQQMRHMEQAVEGILQRGFDSMQNRLRDDISQ